MYTDIYWKYSCIFIIQTEWMHGREQADLNLLSFQLFLYPLLKHVSGYWIVKSLLLASVEDRSLEQHNPLMIFTTASWIQLMSATKKLNSNKLFFKYNMYMSLSTSFFSFFITTMMLHNIIVEKPIVLLTWIQFMLSGTVSILENADFKLSLEYYS